MQASAVRVAARFVGPLTLPGVRSYELGAGPLGFTLELEVKDPDSHGYDRRARPTGRVLLDGGMVSRELLVDTEDDILRAVQRFVSRPTHWFEGEWRRKDGLWSRFVAFR